MALEDLKGMLQEMVDKKRQDKANEDAMRQAKNESDRNKILENVSGDLAKSLQPVLADLAKNSKLSTDDIRQALSEAIQVNMPEIKFPDIPAPIVNVPAPIVNVPQANIPAPVIKVAPTPVNFPEEMMLKPNSKPFPVIMMDQAGKPMQFPVSMGASGGKADFFTIKDIQTSSGASIINQTEGAMKITGTVTTSGSVSSTLSQLVNADGTYYSSDNPLPTTATLSLPSGQGDAATATRVVIAGNSDASVVVNSGTLTTVTTLTSITNSVAAAMVDSTGIQYSGSNPIPTNNAQWNSTGVSTGLNETTNGVVRTVLMTDSNSSVNVTSFNGNTPAIGLNEVVNGTLRVIGVTSAVDSVNMVTINGNAPATGLNETTTGVLRTVTMSDTASSSQSKLIARTTLPTAASDTSSAFQISDKYGREVNRPIQVRDLLATAFVQLTTGTEATLLAATAGAQYDLVWILLSNESTAAVQVDLRGVTAGNKVMSFQVPANGSVGIAPPVPLPNSSGDTGNNWTVDMPDITGTTVDITALFTREI